MAALDYEEAKDIPQLVQRAGKINVSELLLTLDKLVRFGLVIRSGDHVSQKFSLSETGKQTAISIRPAHGIKK